MCPTLQLHELKHSRLLFPPLSPRVCINWSSLNQWCYLTISSSATTISFCLQSFLASKSFQWVSSSHQVTKVLEIQLLHQGETCFWLDNEKEWWMNSHPMNIQSWFPLGMASLISLKFKGLPGVFSSTTIWKHQFFSLQPSLWSSSHIHTWLLEKAYNLIVS